MDERKPPPPRPAPGAGDQWRLDPGDVRRHKTRLTRQREGRSLLGRFSRYAALVVVLVVAVAVYWNFETLRAVRVDVSALTSLFADDSGSEGGTRSPGGEAETAVVEAAGVVGDAAPTSLGDEPPAAETDAAASTPAVVAAEPAPAAISVLRAAPPEPAPPPVAVPEPPAGPETFAFGLDRVSVSEADASAAVIILRSGGRRAASSVSWSTRAGTATAGVDYASLGVAVERFASGEQNRTIHIPIVGDRNVEGPETFYVTLVAGESSAAAGEPLQELEVVINDDD